VARGFSLVRGQGAGAIALPEIDAGRIATRIVSAVQPRAGERAVMMHDATYYPDLANAVHLELTRAGVHPIVALTFERPEVVMALLKDPQGIKKREDEVVAMLAALFADSQLFFWLPARALAPDVRWERLVDKSRVRGIHFHWIQILAGRSAEEIRTLSNLYERAILETDYAALSKEQDRLIAALRGRSIRITSPAGTDLRLHVPADAWFHKNDGDMSPSRAAAGRSARDREMEFPAGALRCIPDVASTEGTLVVPRVGTQVGLVEDLTIEFAKGRAARRVAGKNSAAFQALWGQIGGDIDKVGELVIGTNPLLVGTVPSGDLPYYGYGSGYVRISLGDNWESGGANRSPGSRPLWLFLEGATLEAGGRVLVHQGKLT
jgi:hypothetical protein